MSNAAIINTNTISTKTKKPELLCPRKESNSFEFVLFWTSYCTSNPASQRHNECHFTHTSMSRSETWECVTVAEKDVRHVIWPREVRAVHGKRVNKPGSANAWHIRISTSASRFEHVNVCYHGLSIRNDPIRAPLHHFYFKAPCTYFYYLKSMEKWRDAKKKL